jgi:hypothetical protein
MQVETIDTSVIILNWNGREFLEPCLASLFAQTYRQFEIVLVDNGSSDGSIGLVREKFGTNLQNTALPHLKIVELSQNSGFAGGNLAGLEHCSPQAGFIATLNNDTIAEPAWLETLVTTLKATPSSQKVGAVCGYLLFQSNQTINSAGIEIYRNGLVLDCNIGQIPTFDTAPQRVFGVSAGAALYRREAIEDAGGFFDAAFFAYLEDADLAWRLQLRGWSSLFITAKKAIVWHAHSATGKQGSPFKSFQLGRNRWWVILKNLPAKVLWKTIAEILFYDFSACVYLLMKKDWAGVRGRLAAFAPQYWADLWQKRQLNQKYRLVSDSAVEKWLNKSPSVWSALKLRKSVDIAAKRN